MKYNISGLETLTIAYSDASALRHLDGKISLPRPSQGATNASQVVATIKQNGTTIFTTTAGADGFNLPIYATQGDSITVALTSSEAEDEVLNAVNAVVTI